MKPQEILLRLCDSPTKCTGSSASDTAQGKVLGTLASAAPEPVVLSGEKQSEAQDEVTADQRN
jgi:hypothetical protein